MNKTILETIAMVLIVVWLLGLFSSYTLGGVIHFLLAAAIVVLFLRLTACRPSVK